MTSTIKEALALHTAVETRRREVGLCRWQVAVQADITPWALQQVATGVASQRTRDRLTAWLSRHDASSPNL